MTYDDWYGFFVPAGTPPDRVAYLHRAITTVLKSPAITQKSWTPAARWSRERRSNWPRS